MYIYNPLAANDTEGGHALASVLCLFFVSLFDLFVVAGMQDYSKIMDGFS